MGGLRVKVFRRPDYRPARVFDFIVLVQPLVVAVHEQERPHRLLVHGRDDVRHKVVTFGIVLPEMPDQPPSLDVLCVRRPLRREESKLDVRLGHEIDLPADVVLFENLFNVRHCGAQSRVEWFEVDGIAHLHPQPDAAGSEIRGAGIGVSARLDAERE